MKNNLVASEFVSFFASSYGAATGFNACSYAKYRYSDKTLLLFGQQQINSTH